jgi:hypothetical protein
VQSLLQQASARRRGTPAGAPSPGPSPLKGKFRDETGDLITPSHSLKNGKRLRYYVSNRLISGGTDPTGWRLPAQEFEREIITRIADHLNDQARRHAVLSNADASTSVSASAAIQDLSRTIMTDGAPVAVSLIANGRINANRLSITLDVDAVARSSGLPAADLSADLLTVDAAFAARRRGVEVKIIAADRRPEPDATLIRALRQAHCWSEKLKSGTPLGQIASAVGVTDRYVSRLVPLAALSPKIQAAILKGTQPADLTLERLVRRALPLDWSEQVRVLGIDI